MYLTTREAAAGEERGHAIDGQSDGQSDGQTAAWEKAGVDWTAKLAVQSTESGHAAAQAGVVNQT